MENIRAQLSATLTGGRFPANDTDLSKSVSISQTTPGLGLVATGGSTGGVGGNGIGDDDIFGDADEGKSRPSRADLEKAVLERKRTRPAGIERQVGWVAPGSSLLRTMVYVDCCTFDHPLESAQEGIYREPPKPTWYLFG